MGKGEKKGVSLLPSALCPLRRRAKPVKKHPELLRQYEKTLKLLEVNPNHPSLRLHELKGKLKGLYSVSINMSYRIVINFIITDQDIILINIGSHEQVY